MVIMVITKNNDEYDGAAYGDDMVDHEEGRCWQARCQVMMVMMPLMIIMMAIAPVFYHHQ